MAEHVDMEKLYNALKLSRDAGVPCVLTARQATKLYGEIMALLKIREVLRSDYEQTLEALRAKIRKLESEERWK